MIPLSKRPLLQSQKVCGTLMEITANKEKKKVYQDEFLSFISLLRIAAGRAGGGNCIIDSLVQLGGGEGGGGDSDKIIICSPEIQ